MFRLVVALLLALTVGWKIALSLTNNPVERDDFKPVLVEFLVRQHFAVSEANDIDGMSTLKAIAGDCRLLIAEMDAKAGTTNMIQDFASADDRIFFVYRRAIYTSLPTWSIVANQYWSRFLRKIEFKHSRQLQSSLSLRQRVAMLSDCHGTNSCHPRNGFNCEGQLRSTSCPDADFAVVSNPEFLREGAAIRDFKHPDRIVIGTDDPRARHVIAELYRPLYLNQAPILYTGRRTAELIKYAANAFLATKITFINEIADLCEQLGANVQDVARGIGLDNRIGSKFLHAGPGFGGSCLPKDILALLKTAQDQATPLRIVETVAAVNHARTRGMARKVVSAVGDLRGKTIAVLGLTFKPNTDDMRESPSTCPSPMTSVASRQRGEIDD